MFDAESFVSDCQAAAAEVDPVAAVHEVVAAAIVDGPSIDAALGTESRGEHHVAPVERSDGSAHYVASRAPQLAA